MPLDTSIAMGYRPIQLDDPINKLAQLMQVKSQQNQNALAQYSLEKARREDTNQSMLSSAYRDSLNPDTGEIDQNKLLRALAAGGAGSQIPVVQKAHTEGQEARAKLQKIQGELLDSRLKQSREMLTNVTTPEQYLAWHDANHADPVLGPVLAAHGATHEAAMAQIDESMKQPGGFQQLLQKSSLGLAKFTELNKPSYHNADSGGVVQTLAMPGLGGIPTIVNTIKKVATPGELLSAQTQQRGQNLADARARDSLESSRGKPFEVTGPDGSTVLVQQDKAGNITPVQGYSPKQPQLKPIPSSANTAIIANSQNLTKAKNALALLEGNTLGEMTGDKEATGWKGMLPGSVLNRVDPKGVDTRAAIADLGSMVLHERSGVAVTASEYPRLQPFIPTATDDAATAAKKLKRFIQVYEQENQALGQTYSQEQGYKPNPLASGVKPNSPSTNGLPPDIAALLSKHGGK